MNSNVHQHWPHYSRSQEPHLIRQKMYCTACNSYIRTEGLLPVTHYHWSWMLLAEYSEIQWREAADWLANESMRYLNKTD